MKRIIYFCLLLVVPISTYAQDRKNPLDYPYYIKGRTEINPENGEISLKDISYKGFSCKKENVKTARQVDETAIFKFEEITTDPKISLYGKQLRYWRQDEDGIWITDAEGGNGIAEDRLDKYITVVLVLDCSKSLGADFEKVQSGALSFIDKLRKASPDGNYVNLGIIGFSGIKAADEQTFEIQPLNASAYARATEFVNNLETGSNTALYYAMDKGVGMLEQYVSDKFGSLAPDMYNGTYMLTFTDGLDNASQFKEKKIYKNTEAYEFAKNRLMSTRIKGMSIESFIIGAKGVDLQDKSIVRFKQTLQGLLPANQQNGFTYLDNMSNLENTFADIAEGLVKRWQNLNCYTSVAYEGGVCWTLGEPSVAPPVKQASVSTYPIFCGAHIGIGVDFYPGASVSTGVDFAYPITRKFGLGAYLDFHFKTPDGVRFGNAVGLMMTFGNYSDGPGAVVCGLGFAYSGIDSYESMFDLRAGYLFRRGLYIIGNISMGSGESDDGHYNYYGYFAGELSVKIGYNFGKKRRVALKRD